MKREPVVAIFLALAALLVVGQRFGFTFAGGSGYEKALVATADDAVFMRGETVRTGDVELFLNLAGLGAIQIATHTDVTIERLSKEEIVLRIGTGRATVTATTVPIDVRMDVVEADVTHGGAVFENLPAKRLVHVWLGTGTVQAARRGEMRTPVLSDATLFYDRADREPAARIDNPLQTP